MLIGSGNAPSTGAVVSTTVTVNDPLSCRPPVSIATHETAVEPSRKNEPEARVQTGDGSGSSSASTAQAVKATVAPPTALPSTLMSPGTVSSGAVLSGGASLATSRYTVVDVAPLNVPRSPVDEGINVGFHIRRKLYESVAVGAVMV